MDFAKRLLYKVLQTQDLGPVMERGLAPEMMPAAEDQEALRWVMEFRASHGQVPSSELFEGEFPGIDLPYAPDPASFYAEQVAELYVRNEAIDTMLASASDALSGGGSPFGALGDMRQKFTDLSKFSSVGVEADVRDDAQSRIDMYLRARDSGGLIGIPTPWPSLNDITQGWQEEMLIGVGARPKTGKTWFMLWLAWHAFTHGYNVLFFNKENSTRIMNRRLDAIKFKLDYKSLKDGSLTTPEEQSYFDGLQAWEKEKRKNCFKFFHGATNTAQVEAKVDELNPDLVIVDGAYLLQPSGRHNSEWAREKQISRDLKSIIENTKKPLAYSIQLNREGDLKKRTNRNGVAPISLSDIAGSDAYAQDVDVFLALERTPDMEAASKLRVHPLAVREDQGDSFDVLWSFNPVETRDLGTVTEFISHEDEDEDDGFLTIDD